MTLFNDFMKRLRRTLAVPGTVAFLSAEAFDGMNSSDWSYFLRAVKQEKTLLDISVVVSHRAEADIARSIWLQGQKFASYPSDFLGRLTRKFGKTLSHYGKYNDPYL